MEVTSIEDEVARIHSPLDPERMYKIVVSPDLPGLDHDTAQCSFKLGKNHNEPGTHFPLSNPSNCKGQLSQNSWHPIMVDDPYEIMKQIDNQAASRIMKKLLGE